MIKKYYELKSYVAVQRAYRTEYRNKIPPSPNAINNMIPVFEKTGSVTFMSNFRKKTSDKRKVSKNELETIWLLKCLSNHLL